MRLFVTGGSGVVGRSLVRRLVAEGHTVRVLARSTATASGLQELGAEPVEGDLDDVSALIAGMRDMDGVFHVAGVNEMCPSDPAPMYRVNVDGTRNVVRAANAAGVPRLVYTSSAVVLGEARGVVGHEAVDHRGFALSHYERSKTLAERVAFAEAGKVEVVAVNPSSVQGPGRATGTGKILLDLLNGDLPVMIDTNLSIIDIDDCTEGHLLAWHKGRPGQRYVLSGINLGTRAAVRMIERIVGRDLGVRFVPAILASTGGAVAGLGYRFAGKPPRVCREMIRVLRHGHIYDGSLATRELGLAYRSAPETMRRTIEWFRSEGLIH